MCGRSPTRPRASTRGAPASRPVVSNRSSTTRASPARGAKRTSICRPGIRATELPRYYLLHGIGGDETEWIRFATPDALFDNLIADQVAVPMIVVIPNGRALADDSATGNQFAPEKVAGFARFEQDLLDNLIPAIEKNTRRSPTASTGPSPASRWAAARP